MDFSTVPFQSNFRLLAGTLLLTTQIFSNDNIQTPFYRAPQQSRELAVPTPWVTQLADTLAQRASQHEPEGPALYIISGPRCSGKSEALFRTLPHELNTRIQKAGMRGVLITSNATSIPLATLYKQAERYAAQGWMVLIAGDEIERKDKMAQQEYTNLPKNRCIAIITATTDLPKLPLDFVEKACTLPIPAATAASVANHYKAVHAPK